MMDSSTLLETLQTLFRSVFQQPTLVVTNATKAEDIKGWDSLAHLHLVAAVQKQFSVRFAVREVRKIASVEELVELLRAKGI